MPLYIAKKLLIFIQDKHVIFIVSTNYSIILSIILTGKMSSAIIIIINSLAMQDGAESLLDSRNHIHGRRLQGKLRGERNRQLLYYTLGNL